MGSDESSLIQRVSYPLTRILIIANVVIFAWMSFTRPAYRLDQLISWGANFGPLTTTGQWWRLVTCMFIHVGFLHLFVNMLALRNLGMMLESAMGTPSFLVVYLISGVAGSIMSVTWHPMAISAGASGAIFGLFGAIIGLLLRRRILFGIAIGLPVVKSLIFNIVLNLGISLLPGVDLAAHAGGMVVGLGLGLAIDPDPRRERWWQHPLLVAMYSATGLALLYAWVRGM